MSSDPNVLELVLRRATAGYGLVEGNLPEIVRAMCGPTPGGRSILRETTRTHEAALALAFLAEVTHPATRHLLIQLPDGWVAVVDNGREESDFVDTQQWLCWRTSGRTIRVVDQPGETASCNGYWARLSYEARIVEIYEGPSHRRSITTADDGGRWAFDVAGDVLPIEATFDYTARRKRDRFTSENLKALLASLPAPVVDQSAITMASEYSLLVEDIAHEDFRRRVAREACSILEAADPAHGYFQRAQSWINHIETHASSAVLDLTKAVLLNPAYEQRCRPGLDLARSRLGEEHFQRSVMEAEASLRRGG